MLELIKAVNDAYAILFVVKNTLFNNVYTIKKNIYCAVSPHVVGTLKHATRVIAQPI